MKATTQILILFAIFTAGAVVGGFISYRATVETSLKIMEAQKPLLQQAIEKNTSEIKNTFKNEFRKIKNKNGETELTISPENESDMAPVKRRLFR